MSPHEQADTAENPGYERSDVRVGPLLWLGLTVLLGSAAVFLVLWFLLSVLERQARRDDPQVSPLARPGQAPPAPNLQEKPVEDLQAIRARDEAILTSYGWIDKEKQIVRIPLLRAMDLALERGLPTPAPPTEPPSSQPSEDRKAKSP